MYCASSRLGGKNVFLAAGIETLREAIADLGEVFAAAQDYGTTAEAGAGEARAERARVHGGLDQAVEAGTTYL